MDLMHLRAEFTAAGLERFADAIASLARPGALLVPHPQYDEPLPIGSSRLGGVPDVPRGFDWPRSDGRPMSLVAQIALHELPGDAVAREIGLSGWLLFFIEFGDEPPFPSVERKGSALVHIPAGAELVRGALPQDADPEALYWPCRLEFVERWFLPSEWSLPVQALGLDPEECERYGEARMNLEADGFMKSVLGGWCDEMQNDLHAQAADWHRCRRSNAEGVPVEATDPSEWRLLLQVAGEEVAGMDWGCDGGVLYVMVRDGDLRAGRLDAHEWFTQGT
ncbi:MAG: DUF1963 domain-containing protein [Candidatus Sumerlaeia bacterium]|nr:DUF1963 domain-containing protein [Candidatus Sumerlaeia bacterium]